LGIAIVNTAAGKAFMHEIGHAWGAHFGRSAPVPLNDGAHWNTSPVAGDAYDIKSYLGLSCINIIDLPPSCAYTIEPNHYTYDEYDLYIMGLIPSGDLPDATVLHSMTMPSGGLPGSCGSATIVNPANLVLDEGGERVPDSTTAKHDFDFSVVALNSFTSACYVGHSILPSER